MTFGDGLMEGLEAVGASSYANNGGFRTPLLEMAVKEDKSIAFVGVRESGPVSAEHPEAFTRRHSGFSAIQLEDLARMVPNPMRRFPANIVLIHAGTYELLMTQPEGVNQGSFAEPMGHLNTVLEGFYAINPSGLIVVSNFTGRPSGDPRSPSISAAIEQVVNNFQQRNPDAHIALADHFQKEIPRGHDVLMPNAAGYQAIAEVWYQAIEQYLK